MRIEDRGSEAGVERGPYAVSEESDHIAALRRELEALEAQLQEFVSTISHELRTPITSIRGSLGLLISGSAGELSAEAKELIDIAERNSVRLADMIKDIVDLHRLETGDAQLHLVDSHLEAVLSQAVDSVDKMAVERDVKVEVTASDVSVVADGDRLQQAIEHLLSNALKASPAGETVLVSLETDAAWVTIKVGDRGRGLSKSLQAGIFDRYRSSDSGNPRPKKGLGLALARAITERHHGAIGVESEEGRGSTFWIRVPRSPIPDPLTIHSRPVP